MRFRVGELARGTALVVGNELIVITAASAGSSPAETVRASKRAVSPRVRVRPGSAGSNRELVNRLDCQSPAGVPECGREFPFAGR